jgi:hypothetical protein
VTVTAVSSLAGTPRKLICVRGVASRLPGRGDTVTDPFNRAEVFNVLGEHAGAGVAARALPIASTSINSATETAI